MTCSSVRDVVAEIKDNPLANVFSATDAKKHYSLHQSIVQSLFVRLGEALKSSRNPAQRLQAAMVQLVNHPYTRATLNSTLPTLTDSSNKLTIDFTKKKDQHACFSIVSSIRDAFDEHKNRRDWESIRLMRTIYGFVTPEAGKGWGELSKSSSM